MTSLIGKIGFTNKQAFGLLSILLLIVGGAALPESAYKYFFSGATDISRDVIREEIEAYIDLAPAPDWNSPYQTAKAATFIVGVIDVSGTDNYYLQGGLDGKLDDFSTDADLVLNWATGPTGNMSSGGILFIRTGNYTIDQTWNSNFDRVKIIGEAQGFSDAAKGSGGVRIDTNSDITMFKAAGTGDTGSQRVQRLEIHDIWFQGPSGGGSQYLLNFTFNDFLILDGVRVKRATYAIMFKNLQWSYISHTGVDNYQKVAWYFLRTNGAMAQNYFEGNSLTADPATSEFATGIVFERGAGSSNPIRSMVFEATHFAQKDGQPAGNTSAIYVKPFSTNLVLNHVIFRNTQSESNRLLLMEGKATSFRFENGFHDGQNSGLDGMNLNSTFGGTNWTFYVGGMSFLAVTGAELNATGANSHIIVNEDCTGIDTIAEKNGGEVHLPSVTVPFVEGISFNTTNPYGWYINSANEFAATFIRQPGWTGLFRVQVLGATEITDAQGMMLNITIFAGNADELITNEFVTVNATSTTQARVGRYIRWDINIADDPDLDDIGEWDWMQIIVFHNVAGGGGEAATDAVIQSVRVEGGVN